MDSTQQEEAKLLAGNLTFAGMIQAQSSLFHGAMLADKAYSDGFYAALDMLKKEAAKCSSFAELLKALEPPNLSFTKVEKPGGVK